MKGLRLGATASLSVLFAINLANYVDRYLVIGLAKAIQGEFKIGDAEVGMLTASFVLVYVLASPLCGAIADRIARRWVVASAVALWSVATAGATRAHSFQVLLGLRGGVGVGEAGYNASGQALLSDIFPPEKRSRVLAIFNLALPVGAAAGYGLAGLLEPRWGWKNACLIVGLPGLVLAGLALLLPDPKREEAPTAEPAKQGGVLSAYAAFVRDPVFVANALGFAMQSFALGALGQWAPLFFDRVHSKPPEEANKWIGGILAGAGLVGTALGAYLGDVVARRSRRSLLSAYGWVTAIGYFAAAPVLALGLILPWQWALGCMFLAMVGAFLGTGPQNAIVSTRAPVLHRASAFAFVVVMLHLLGDAPSPFIVGATSDALQARGMERGQALQYALFITPAALAMAGVAMSACAVFARSSAVRAEAAP